MLIWSQTFLSSEDSFKSWSAWRCFP